MDLLDRPTGVPIRRYERARPGELVHLDVKKLGRIPAGGGHRVNGDRTRRGRGLGHDFIHVAVDDHSRLAYVEVHPDERGETAAGFMLRVAGSPFMYNSGISVAVPIKYGIDLLGRHATL